MRRFVATLLVSVVGFPLIAPALIADANASLPACCRRDGQHHCSMSAMMGAVGMDASASLESGVAWSGFAPKCPYFPKGGALVPHSGAGLMAAAHPVIGTILTQTLLIYPISSGFRITYANSHPKRGPPCILS